jgi:hypothetical protein
MNPSPFRSQQIAVLDRKPDRSPRVDLLHAPGSIEHDSWFEHNATFAARVGPVHVCRHMAVKWITKSNPSIRA